MHLSRPLAFLAAVTGVLSYAVELPAGVPRSLLEFREKHPYTAPADGCRKTIQIRASENDTDDVSEEFRKGIQEANNGGTLYLPKGKTFVIAKALDLTSLNDIHVHLEGEIKVRDTQSKRQQMGCCDLTRDFYSSSPTMWRTGKYVVP